MNLKVVLPFLMSVFGLTSILVLKSVAPSLASQQFIFYLVGMSLFFLASRISYSIYEKYSLFLYGGLCVLLVITEILGSVTRGSTRWISVGGVFNIQASQLVIPIVCLVIAHFMTHHPLSQLKNLLIALGLVALPAVLIFIEPDLGTTIVYLVSIATLFFFGNLKIHHIMNLIAFGLILSVIAWMFVLQPYQKERVFSFASGHEDASGAGYNAQQSLIAVGSGKFLGRGLGQGIQSHLRFLPERQTDFIFASLSEELGFVGSAFIVLLYISLVMSLFALYQNTRSEAGRLYILTLITMISFQAGVNMGMNMGLFPITGVTLPLLSYGGSSVISILVALAIAQSTFTQNRHKSVILVGTKS